MTPPDPTLLRDVLAIDRTVLANERTLLAYGRSLLALIAGGATVMHFVEEWWAVPAGAALIGLGILLFAYGLWRYRVVGRHLARARENLAGVSGGAGLSERQGGTR
jgi:putative membrane protein